MAGMSACTGFVKSTCLLVIGQNWKTGEKKKKRKKHVEMTQPCLGKIQPSLKFRHSIPLKFKTSNY